MALTSMFGRIQLEVTVASKDSKTLRSFESFTYFG
jgi:hypothetical protein